MYGIYGTPILCCLALIEAVAAKQGYSMAHNGLSDCYFAGGEQSSTMSGSVARSRG